MEIQIGLQYSMKSLLLVCLLVLELGFGEPTICLADHPPSLLQLPQLPLKYNPDFTFKITNRAAPAALFRTPRGTFFQGNFSTLTLTGYNETFVYHANSFSFKYPAQHRIAQLTQEVLEMQVLYQLQEEQRVWKHKRLALSVSFVLTDYAPDGGFTLKEQIRSSMKNGTVVSFSKLLPLVPGLKMVLYKGIHSQFPEDRSFLWLLRRELLLMSESELQAVKELIFEHVDRQNLRYHGLLERLSDLNEIREAEKFEGSYTDGGRRPEL